MTRPIDYDKLARALRDLLALIPSSGSSHEDVPTNKAKKLAKEIRQAIERLGVLARGIDPIRQPDMIFDPYQPQILGRFTGETLLAQERRRLADLPRFYGSGVYALYYRGNHQAYAAIRNKDTPVYAGKADPANTHAATPEEQGDKLAGRLAEHAKSIRAASNLNIEDFDCRYLVVRSGLQKAAEDYLLAHFRPVWNQPLCKGFGKHGDAATTRANTRSEWDTLHPGRPWATSVMNKPNPKTPREIINAIRTHYDGCPPRE